MPITSFQRLGVFRLGSQSSPDTGSGALQRPMHRQIHDRLRGPVCIEGPQTESKTLILQRKAIENEVVIRETAIVVVVW